MLIVALSRFTVMAVFLPVVTVGTATRDAWLAAILATLAGMAVGVPAAVLAARFPGQSLGTLARSVAGVPGLVLAALYGVFYFAVAVVEARLITLLLITATLPATPGWAVALPMLLIAVYGAALGPDTLGRSGEILITFLLVALMLSLFFLTVSRTMEAALLRPVLARGIRPVLSSIPNPLFWFGVSAGSVLALGKYCESSRLVKPVVAGTAISGVLLTVMALIAIATLGPGEAADQLSPMLTVARTVYLPGIAERLDVLLLNMLMIAAVFDVTLFLLVSAVILGDVLNVRGRAVVIVLGLLAVVPLTQRQVTMFNLLSLFDVVPSAVIVAIVYVGLVGGLLVAALLQDKKGDSK